MDIIAVIEKIITWKKTSLVRKFLLMTLIISIQLLIAFLIYDLGGTKNSYVYLELSLIIVGGFVFGPLGGAFLGATGGWFLGPVMPADTGTMLMQDRSSWLFRLFFYIFTGYVSGIVIRYLLSIIDRLSSITLYNPVTQLPNKKYFENRSIKYASDDRVAVIKFEEYPKMIENFGIDYAINFIKEISCIFVEVFNKVDKKNNKQNVYHLEDDKFALVFSESEIKDCFKSVYKNIYRSIKEKELEYFPSSFIGISRCSESNIKILQNAETARRWAKKNLKFYKEYSPELSQKSNKNFDLSLEIPRAINNREFFLCYHPKISLTSGEVEGVEALIRWQHPEKGLIPPDAFIPYIEKTAMISKVTKWVLKKSFSDIKKMQNENININISVNIPLKILENSKIIKYIDNNKKNQLPLHKLELEILERDNVENFKKTSSAMKTLKEIGIDFSLDDYGTGYSTLSYMQNLPFDKIKIDRMFTRDIETNEKNRELIGSTIDIVHTLGMEVVAEGVETKEALEILKSMGCDYAQGYYFTKPLKYDDFIKWYRGYCTTKKPA